MYIEQTSSQDSSRSVTKTSVPTIPASPGSHSDTLLPSNLKHAAMFKYNLFS